MPDDPDHEARPGEAPAVRRPANVFADLVHGVCDRRDDLDELYAERTHVTHPMAGGEPLTSRPALRAHFAAARRAFGQIELSVGGVTVHETGDPETIVAEFRYLVGLSRAEVPCVFVMRVRNGLIVESRDYIDEAAFGRALATDTRPTGRPDR